jgi:hypothetical protein
MVNLLVAGNVYASPDDRNFTVRLRALFGEGMPKDVSGVSLGDSIGDLRKKLERLNKYASYRLVQEETRVVPESQVETVSLGEYGEVSLRPLSSGEEDVVTIWLRWSKSDMEILNTKLKFGCKDALIAGIENEHDGGVLLAVNVSPN